MTTLTDTISIGSWSTCDADDRFRGEYTAHLALATVGGHGFHLRITPGDHDTYRAQGVYVEIDDHTYNPRMGHTFQAANVEAAKLLLPGVLAILGHDLAAHREAGPKWAGEAR